MSLFSRTLSHTSPATTCIMLLSSTASFKHLPDCNSSCLLLVRPTTLRKWWPINNQIAHGKSYSPVTPPFGGQPSASMPSSAAALAPSFSMSALYLGSLQALQGRPNLMRLNL